ncbi:MAG: GNAT family N-acetyltransferase [Bacillota bacterium]
MEYRSLRESEIPAWRALMEYAFVFTPAEYEPRMQNVFRLEMVRVLADEAGSLAAALVLDPFRLHWEGRTLAMGGVASVGSPPETRRRGHVRRLMASALAEMKEREMPLSGLYPFEEAFYRRLGWGDGVAQIRHTIPVSMLQPLQRAPGEIRRLGGGWENWAEFDPIYTRWASARRGPIVRGTEAHWRRRVNGPTHQSYAPLHAAIWSPAPGAEPEGYMLYRFDKTGDDHNFAIHEWVALTPAALEGLLGFAANHDSRVRAVVIKALPDLPLWHLIRDPGDTESRIAPAFQIRLVDLARAYAERPWPVGVTGSLTIGVHDELAPWNSGGWRIQFEAGHATAEPTKLDNPDLLAPIEVWSQIYAGGVTPLQAQRLGRLAVTNPVSLDLLARATAGDPLLFFEFF